MTDTALPPRPARGALRPVDQPPAAVPTVNWREHLKTAARTPYQWFEVPGTHARSTAHMLRVGEIGGAEHRPIEVTSRKSARPADADTNRVTIFIRYAPPKDAA